MWQWQTLNRKKCFKLSFKDTELKKQGMWHLHFSCRHYQWHSLCPSQWGFDTTTKLQNKATATKGCFSISHPKNCKLGLSCIFVAKNNASNNQPFQIQQANCANRSLSQLYVIFSDSSMQTAESLFWRLVVLCLTQVQRKRCLSFALCSSGWLEVAHGSEAVLPKQHAPGKVFLGRYLALSPSL